MKINKLLWSLILSASLTGLASAAGGPMNEDLTTLLPTAQKALDAGKSGDAETFMKEAQEALREAGSKANSASQQRIYGRMKRAVGLAKTGNLPDATQNIEEAMTDMKKSGPLKFGGGS